MKVLKLLLLGVLFLITTPALADLSGCRLVSDYCTGGGGARPVSDQNGYVWNVTPSSGCWQKTQTWQCYDSTQIVNTCTPDVVGGCTLANSACSQWSGSTCVAWSHTYVCENQKTTTCSPTAPASNCSIESTTCNENTYGYCTNETKAYQCTEAPTACNSNPECTLEREECTSTINGVCQSVRQIYSCNKTTQVCEQTKRTNSCTGISTYGLESQATAASNGAMQQVIAAMELVDTIKKSISGNPPTLFAGEEMTCSKELGSGLVDKNCCSRDVKEGGSFVWKCSSEEVQLAAAKRKNMAYEGASGCVSGIESPLGGGCMICSKERKWYCVFDSLLARIIHEQGRAQLAELAASGVGGASSASLDYAFYNEEGSVEGRWQGPLSVNDNHLYVWRWPAICNAADPADIPAGTSCPGMLETYFASCAGGATACGAPSADPSRAQPDQFTIKPVSVFEKGSIAISRYAILTPRADFEGAGCDTDPESATFSQCRYRISAWPGGAGGVATLQINLSWPLFYSTEPSVTNPVQIGSYAFTMNTHSFNNLSGNPSISINYSSNKGTTWSTQHLSPLILETDSVYLAGTDIQIYGSCEAPGYQCRYIALVPNSFTAKPWITHGPKRNDCNTSVTMDCTGFTIEQFQMMDLSKMNLDEFKASLEPTMPDTSALATTAGAQAEAMKGAQLADKAPAQDSDEGANNELAVRLDKTLCQIVASTNTCTFRLEAQSNWPMTYADSIRNTDPVARVIVDWGDGQSSTLTGTQMVSSVPMLVGSHTYTSIGKKRIRVRFEMPDGRLFERSLAVEAYKDDPPTSKANQTPF